MVREIAIHGSVYPSRQHYEAWRRTEYMGSAPHGDRPIVPIDSVLGEIREAKRSGAGAILLTVDSLGGNNSCCQALYRALLDFPGRAVAFVRRAWSAMPMIVQAADVVVVDPDGDGLVFHGTNPTRSQPDTAADNDAWLSLLADRLGCERAVYGFLFASSEEYGQFRPEPAVRLGFADVVGSLEDARRLAEDLAAGRPMPTSERSRRLRPAAPVEAGELAAGVVCHRTASSDGSSGSVAFDVNDVYRSAAEAAAGNWDAPTLPAGTPRAVCYARGPRLYVMVGDSGFAAWSTNGTDWIAATTVPNINCVSVAYSEALAIWVAVGNGVAMSSTDAKTWTQRTITGNYKAVTVAPDGKFAAVGLAGAASRSVSGTSWSAASTPPVGDYYAISSSPTSLVAVGNGTIASSPSGDVWTARTDPMSGATVYAGVAHAGTSPSKWIALGGGSTPAAVTSGDDGATWAAAPAICSAPAAIGWNGLIWLVTQTSLLPVLTSRDGAAWKTRDAVYKALIPTPAWGSLTFGNRWVAAGASAGAMVSAAANY